MKTINNTLVTAQPLNVSSSSVYQQLKSIYTYSIMVVITTGTPTGSLKLQASNDPETNDTQVNSTGNAPATGPSNWADVASSTVAITAVGNTLYNVDAVGYNYVRVVYTDTSGGASTSVMKIIFNGKGV